MSRRPNPERPTFYRSRLCSYQSINKKSSRKLRWGQYIKKGEYRERLALTQVRILLISSIISSRPKILRSILLKMRKSEKTIDKTGQI